MTVEEYWREFKEKTGDTAQKYSAWHFCDNEKDAIELSELVVQGKKKATASNAWVFEYENESIPRAGDISIITDFFVKPVCVIKTVRVDVVPFDNVTAEFAATEGEGDLSLDFWRDAHKRFFTRECKRIGKEFSGEMPVVCERFEVVYV